MTTTEEAYLWEPASPSPAAAGAAGAEGTASKTKAGEDAPAELERPRLITVDEAVAEALSANRTVQNARLAAAIATTFEREAKAGLLPSLIFSGRYTRRSEPPQVNSPEIGGSFTVGPSNEASYDVTLGFPVFGFGRYINRYKAAKLARQGSEADSLATDSDIAAAVTAAAYDLLLTIRTVGVAEASEKAFEQQVKDSQALFDAGRVTKSDVLEAQVQHDATRREREKAQSLVAIKRQVLNQLLGRPADAPTEVVDDPIEDEPKFDVRRMLVEAQEKRPELRAARLAVEAAVREHKAAIGEALPEFRGYLRYQGTDSRFATPSDWGTAGVTLDIPLYLGGANYARIRRASLEVDSARLTLADLEVQVYREVAAAHRDVVESYKDIAVAALSIERSKESLRIQREKFNSGRATSREVLDTTTLLTNALFSHVSAIYTYNNALQELRRARGGDPRRPPLTTHGPAEEKADAGDKETKPEGD